MTVMLSITHYVSTMLTWTCFGTVILSFTPSLPIIFKFTLLSNKPFNVNPCVSDSNIPINHIFDNDIHFNSNSNPHPNSCFPEVRGGASSSNYTGPRCDFQQETSVSQDPESWPLKPQEPHPTQGLWTLLPILRPAFSVPPDEGEDQAGDEDEDDEWDDWATLPTCSAPTPLAAAASWPPVRASTQGLQALKLHFSPNDPSNAVISDWPPTLTLANCQGPFLYKISQFSPHKDF